MWSIIGDIINLIFCHICDYFVIALHMFFIMQIICDCCSMFERVVEFYCDIIYK